MIFEYIKFQNYRPYYGTEILYFRDKTKQNDQIDTLKTNIVLIGGLNGHGKTSLINSINICLFGHRKSQNKNEFSRYLSRSVNNQHVQDGYNDGAIELAFSDEGGRYALKVVFNTDGKYEQFIYELDSNLNKIRKLSMTEDELNDFIDQRIPLDVSQFFIFDAEKIRELVGDQEKEETIEAIQQIMSLNIYKKLSDDLDTMFRRNTKEIKDTVSEKEIQHVLQKLQAVTDKIDVLDKSIQKTNEKLLYKKNEVADLKKKRRDLLIKNSDNKQKISKRLGDLEARLKKVNDELWDSKGELYELILQPHINALKNVVIEEKRIKDSQYQLQSQFAPYRTFIKELLASDYNPKLSFRQKRQIRRNGRSIWAKLHKLQDDPDLLEIKPLHDLSDSDYQRIRNAKEKSHINIQELVEQKQKYEDQIRINNEALKNAPDPVDTSDLDKQISILDRKIGEQEKTKKTDIYNKSSYESKKESLTRQYNQLYKTKTNLEPLERKNVLIGKTQETIQSFIRKVTVLKADELKREIEAILEQLFKKDEFNRVEFNETTFTLSIYNHLNEEIRLESRSEGEKQLISLAMIWALTKVSGSNFPFVIDTPLARLDSIHRSNLVNHYFTKLSDQVIILSTDTEITKDFYEELKPFIEKSYTLEFDETKNTTTIKEGYFFDLEEDISWQM